MSCYRCAELQAKIRALEDQLYGPLVGDTLPRSVAWVTGFRAQQRAVAMVLYRAARPLSAVEIHLRLPMERETRAPATIRTQVCMMRQLLPGCIVTNREEIPATYDLAPDVRERIKTHQAHLKEGLSHERDQRIQQGNQRQSDGGYAAPG